jgi:23S rRNA (guanosine2251-2'-O)-methyltransferase
MSAGILTLKNPHSVLAAIRHRPKDVLSVEVSPHILKQSERGAEAQLGRDAWLRVIQQAEKLKIPVKKTEPRSSDVKDRRKLEGDREAAAQALVKAPEGVSAHELFDGVSPQDRRLWLAIDQVQDPHNLGSIFRTASFFGVSGIITTSERVATLTSTVLDVACGGVESVPFAVETNLVRALEKAKEKGIWVLGTSEHAEHPLSQIEKDRPWLVVLGNEDNGELNLYLLFREIIRANFFKATLEWNRDICANWRREDD